MAPLNNGGSPVRIAWVAKFHCSWFGSLIWSFNCGVTAHAVWSGEAADPRTLTGGTVQRNTKSPDSPYNYR